MSLKSTGQVALVTGGNGFLGTALVRQLTECGVTVHVLGNRRQHESTALLPSDRIHVGQRSAAQIAELLEEIKPSTIFHLATVSKEPETPLDIDAMVEGNLSLGIKLLFAASRQRTPPAIINAGTYWQFGDSPGRSPNCLYAATKQSFHELMLYYRDKYRIPALTLILYDTFAANDRRPKLWNTLIAATPGTDFPLTQGDQIVHLVHATDVVRAFLMAAELLQDGRSLEALYSAHSFCPRPLRELVTALNSRAHLDLTLSWGAIPYPRDQIFNPWVGKSLPGWEPGIDVLEAMVEYASAHKVNTAIHGVRVG